MSFLKFLKRDKKADLDELDLPPEPPPLDDFNEKLPDMPEFPEINAESDEKDFKFDYPSAEQPESDKGFELPEFDPEIARKILDAHSATIETLIKATAQEGYGEILAKFPERYPMDSSLPRYFTYVELLRLLLINAQYQMTQGN